MRWESVGLVQVARNLGRVFTVLQREEAGQATNPRSHTRTPTLASNDDPFPPCRSDQRLRVAGSKGLHCTPSRTSSCSSRTCAVLTITAMRPPSLIVPFSLLLLLLLLAALARAELRERVLAWKSALPQTQSRFRRATRPPPRPYREEAPNRSSSASAARGAWRGNRCTSSFFASPPKSTPRHSRSRALTQSLTHTGTPAR